MRISSLIGLATAALFALLVSGPLLAQEAQPIGLMLSTSGVVTAEDEEGNVRRLQRRSPVYEGDTLITANRSRAQVRFNDRGLIALHANTSFFIEEHNYEGQEDGTESAVYSLLRGGLAAITGLIGHSNKDRYQVSTPLATIGLRGTHWTATFCTTACDGNPPGLYGGVADGGIDVCNGGGCTAVDSNTYFYTPDANTQPQTLISPPSVVFSDAADDTEQEGEEEQAEEGEGGEGDAEETEVADEETTEEGTGDEADSTETTDTAVTETTEGGEEPQEDTVSDVATFVERSTSAIESADEISTLDQILEDTADVVTGETEEDRDDADPTATVATRSADEEEEVEDIIQGFVDEDGEIVLVGEDESVRIEDGEVVVRDEEGEVVAVVGGTTIETTAAPAGSVIALASAREVSPTTAQSAALNVLIYPSGTTALPRGALTEADTGETDEIGEAVTTTALAALDFELSEGCSPCLYATAGLDGTSATLAESIEITVDGVDVFLGRWQGDALLTDTGDDLNALQDHHYAIALVDGGSAFSPDLPSVDIIDENAIGIFNLTAATTVTDDAGILGTLDSAELVMDFYRQFVSSFDMNISFEDGRSIASQIDAPFSFPTASVGASFVPLSGSCLGGTCGEGISVFGDTSLSFIGDASEHLLGAYSLDNDDLQQSVFGTYLLGLDSTFDPLVVDDLVGFSAADGYALFSTTEISGSLFQPFNSGVVQVGDSGSVELANIYDTANIFAGLSLTSGTDCDPCLFEVVDGRLVDRGTLSFLGNTLTYGTWALTDSLVTETGTALPINDVVSFFYSPEDNLLIPDLLTDISPSIASFSYLGGPAPTSEDGTLGVINSIELGIDLFYQQVTNFDIDLTIADRLYDAGMVSYADLVDVLAGSLIYLSGNCTGGDCLTGELLSGSAELSFLGPVSDPEDETGVIGSFALQTETAVTASTSATSNVGLDLGAEITFAPGERTAAGIFVLEQNETLDHPDYITDFGVPVVSTGIASVATIASEAGEFGATGTTQNSDFTEIGLTALGDDTRVLVDFISLDSGGEGGILEVESGFLEEYAQIETLIANRGIEDETGALSMSDDFAVSLGRWNALESSLSLNGNDVQIGSDIHFAYASNTTDLISLTDNPFAIVAPILGYSLIDSTAPSDEAGNLGELFQVDMEIDLFQQSVTDFYIDLAVGDESFEAWLFEPAYLLEEEINLRLMGACSGGSCGSSLDILGQATIGLAGATAEAALGNYGLFANYGEFPDSDIFLSDTAVTGVFLLGRDFVADNDYWFIGEPEDLIISDAGQGFVGASLVSESNVLQGLQTGFIADEDSFFALYQDVPAVYGYNFADDDGDESLVVSEEGGAFLIEKDFYEFGDSTVVWGRWFGPDGFDTDFDGQSFDTGTDAHFAWSDAVTDFSSITESGKLASYSYEGGTSPTDEFGNSGEVNYVSLQLDLFQQAIVDFDLEVEIAERLFTAGLSPTNSTYFLDGAYAELDLVGLCSGAGCEAGVDIEGETSLIFVGDEDSENSFDAMAGVMGSYALQTREVEDEFFDLFELVDDFAVGLSETEVEEVVFDGPYVSATGTYFLLGQETENLSYVDFTSTEAPAIVEATSGGVVFTTAGYSDDFYGVAGSSLILDGSTDETFYLSALNGADNLLVGFDSVTEDEYYGPFSESLSIFEGVLAEEGGISSFLADNGLSGGADFGINWGRWHAGAELIAGELDLTDPLSPVVIDPETFDLGSNHHFIYADATIGVLPSFANPSTATYVYAGGTAPTDEYGRTGVMDAHMDIDLFTQTLTDFELNIEIADRIYYAFYDKDYDLFGLDLSDLDEQSIDLRGVCVGGDCGYFDLGYENYGPAAIQLVGSAELSPFGDNGEGFFGGFALGEDYYSSATTASLSLGGQTLSVGATGTFVLAQDQVSDHIGWQVDPLGVAAAPNAGAVVTGTLINSATSAWHPVVGLSNELSPTSFTTIDIDGLGSNIVDSFTTTNAACSLCGFEVSDAVVIATGEVDHGYQYLSGPSLVSWASWANRDQAGNDWLFDEGGSALDSGIVVNTIFAENLTQTDVTTISPLTGYSNVAYYSYAGGPPPVNENTDLGFVDQITLNINFFDQQVNSFTARFSFDSENSSYIYLEQDNASRIDLAPSMQIGLLGDCSGCGTGSTTTFFDFEGIAHLALVGDDAEQIIGGIEAWSEEVSGIAPEGAYTVEAGFVLNQEFDYQWIDSADTRVTDLTASVFAPIFSDGSLLVPVTLAAVDDGLGSVELGLIEYSSDFANFGGKDDSYLVFGSYDTGAVSISVNEGILTEFGTSYGGLSPYTIFLPEDATPWFEADWGVWDSQDYVYDFSAVSGVVGSPLPYMPYAVSEDATLSLPSAVVTGGTGSLAQYSYLGGPSVVSNVGTYGWVEEVLMSFDFMTGSVTDFYLAATDPGYNRYEVWLDSYNAETSTTYTIFLSGLCVLCDSGVGDFSASGQTLVSFIGDSAEGALGSFALVSAASATTGAYVLQQNDHWVSSPDVFAAEQGGVVAFAATELDEVLEESDGISFGFYLDETNTADLTQVNTFDHNHPNALAGFSVSADECVNCDWDVTDAELASYDNTNAPGYDHLPDAYWGRWMSEDDLEKDAVAQALTEYQHFAYSPDPSDYADEVWMSSHQAEYSYVGGSRPTDNMGNEGYVQHIQMTLDFADQSITEYEMGVSVGSFDYDVGIESATALDAAAPFANLDLVGDSFDYSTSTNYSAEGNSSVFFIGADADAAIGTFDLNTLGVEHSVNGAFLLEQQGEITVTE